MANPLILTPVGKPDSVELHMYGGPYRQKPDNIEGVKMAVEITAPCLIDIPTHDFSIPDVATLVHGLEAGYRYMVESERPLYVGCMGGIGRTGLYMAAMHKLCQTAPKYTLPIVGSWGWQSPPARECRDYIRAYYNAHAVETSGQLDFIEDLDLIPLAKKLWTAKVFKR